MVTDSLRFENRSENVPRLAIFRKSARIPSLGLITWNVVAPLPGGTATVHIPSGLQVHTSDAGGAPMLPRPADERVREISGSISSAWGHLLLGGDHLLAPGTLPQDEPLEEEEGAPAFYVAPVGHFVHKGTKLADVDQAVEMVPGQTLVVTGSRMDGFVLDVI